MLFVLPAFLTVSASSSNSQEDAVSSISEAELSMAHAYKAVLDAEDAGARNVSGLLARLNDGAELLSEAHMAFEAGDFEEAIRLAVLSREVGWDVKAEAGWLGVEADHASVDRAQRFVVTSALGVSFVLVASLLSYLIFKRRYYTRLLKNRPKVDQV